MAEAELEVCEALKVGKCPHGISGRILVNGVLCSKAQPKRYQKFTRFGTNAKKGCTLGSNCEHYHTQHCKSSQKTGSDLMKNVLLSILWVPSGPNYRLIQSLTAITLICLNIRSLVGIA